MASALCKGCDPPLADFARLAHSECFSHLAVQEDFELFASIATPPFDNSRYITDLANKGG